MEKRQGSVKLHARPALRQPHLVAAWSGMGAVALLTANYLRQELDAAFFGEIDPYDYFSPSQVQIKDGLIQAPELPQTKFYFWNKGEVHDLIFLIGTEQPPDPYEMALQVLDTAQQFGVERIYTSAAFPTLIHHSQEPGVRGTATHPYLVAEMKTYGVGIMDQGTIGGLNGLLLAIAKERNIEGLCLLGDIPLYTTQMINPGASHAILAVLTRMLNLEIDLKRLTVWAEDLRPEMDKLYSILPRRIREATEPTQAEQPLVADARFFDEIERFLEHGWRPEDEDEDEG